MQLLKAVPFSFEGRNYEVRVFAATGRYEVRAFLDGKPANGYSYFVDEVTNLDVATTRGYPAYEHLIELAKSDIQNRVWEQYLAAIRQ